MTSASVRRAVRRHEILPHTADVGLRAEGPDLRAVFEEAAVALAELVADVSGSPPVVRRTPIECSAADLAALAFTWLNELVGLVDVHGALARATIAGISPDPRGWRLRGEAALVPWDRPEVRRRADVKSATYHRLAVVPIPGGWSITAYLDL
jgi:SHS2 domain-containing protein